MAPIAHPALALLLSPAYTLPPALLGKAQSLAHWETWLYFGGTAWELLLLGLLLRSRLGAAIAGWAHRITARQGSSAFSARPFRAGLFVVTVWLLLSALIALPGAILAHAVYVRYGLSVARWLGWWGDWAKSQAGTLVIGTLILSGLFALLRHTPRLWWLWFWALSQPFVILGTFLAPIAIDPLFNTFTPLAQSQPALVARLQQAAKLGGLNIPASRIFVEDASRRSNSVNAYVTGIGSSKRVVVWDTTLKQVPPNEILAIYAHEQGHYVLGHIWKGILFEAALTFVLFALLAWLFRWLARAGSDRWHIDGPSDWAALPLLLLLVSAAGFLTAPIANAWSRMDEHAADLYGQHLLSRMLPHAAAIEVEDFNRLGRSSLSTPHPNPFVVWWTYSHPPIGKRAEDARTLGQQTGTL